MCLCISTLVSSKDSTANQARYTRLCGCNTRMSWPSTLHCLHIGHSPQAFSFQFFIRIFYVFWVVHVLCNGFKELISLQPLHSKSIAPKIQERSLLIFFQYCQKKKRRSESTISSHDASTLDWIWSINCWSIFLSIIFSHDQVRVLNWNHTKSFKHDRVKKAIFSHDMITLIFSQVSHALSLSEVQCVTHPPASNGGTCRLWDLDLPDDEQGEGSHIWKIKFSEDGVLLAIKRWKTLEMWKVSIWELVIVIQWK